MNDELKQYIETAYNLLKYGKSAITQYKIDQPVVYVEHGTQHPGKIEEIFKTGRHIDMNGTPYTATPTAPVYSVRMLRYDTLTGNFIPEDIVKLAREAALSPFDQYSPSLAKNDTVDIEYKFESCAFYKATDGTLYVYGIYSSHYLDSDDEILTASAHKNFAEGVNNGTFAYPDIYIAHIEVPVGKCEMIDYDTDGFALFGGKIKNDWVKTVEMIITKSIDAGIDLGLSHGFMNDTVEHDDDGDIIRYVSHEVSILPLYGISPDGERIVSASNKYTALLSGG